MVRENRIEIERGKMPQLLSCCEGLKFMRIEQQSHVTLEPVLRTRRRRLRKRQIIKNSQKSRKNHAE